MPTKFSVTLNVAPNERRSVCALLASETELSKQSVKDAMTKGAVFLKTKGATKRRCRRATTIPRAGDILEFNYDAGLLARKPPTALCLFDQEHYSVWMKPAGVMTQGTLYGDHCSLQRQAECHFNPRRQVYIVHRLDREAAGVILLAHSKTSANRLSKLFRERLVRKTYHLEVAGDLRGKTGGQGRIELPLDGKSALTRYDVLAYRADTDIAIVAAEIETGRFHQLRRHFDLIGHPVIGDPRYGTNNKNNTGLRLVCVSLAFHCPFAQREMNFQLIGRQEAECVSPQDVLNSINSLFHPATG